MRIGRTLLALFLLLGLAWSSFSCTVPAPTTPTPTPSPTPQASPPTPNPTPRVVYTLPSVTEVVDKVRPAVVSILTETVEYSFFFQPIPRRGAGSGVIFQPDGYILTNNHVVEGADKIAVSLPDRRTFPGKVVGTDPLTDLAVVKVEAKGLPIAPFGDSEKLRVGDWVIAIGNAQALPGGPTVTIGIVSALGRSIPTSSQVMLHDLIQTDAAINEGNSGGPLINLAGEVVGINTAIIAGAQNIGFAISAASALPVREELVKNGRVVWPWLGISAATLTPAIASELKLSASQGVLIDAVYQDSPAHKAGLRRNDVIVQLAGEKIETIGELQKTLRKHKIGEAVEIAFVRNSDTKKTQATLAEMPRRS